VHSIFYLLFFFFYLLPIGFAQQTTPKIDSIQKVLAKATSKHKVDLLVDLCREYQEINWDTLFVYAKQANELSESLNYTEGIANSCLFIGLTRQGKRKYNEAREYYFRAFQLFDSVDKKKGKANASNGIGNTYIEQGDYANALKYHSLALEIREEIGDKQATANSFNNIGNIYAGQENGYMALKNYLKSLAIKEEINDTSFNGKTGLAISYFLVGRLYTALGNYAKSEEFLVKAEKIYEQLNEKGGQVLVWGSIGGIYDKQNRYEKAIECYIKALAIAKENGNNGGEVTDNYIRLGNIYYRRASEHDGTSRKKYNEDYDIALEYAIHALELSNIQQYEIGKVNCYTLMGNVYRQQGKNDKATVFLNKALSLTRSPSIKIIILEGLYLTQLKQQDYKGAFTYYQHCVQLRDSLYNTQNTLKYAQLGDSYEEDKKEKIRELTNKIKETTHLNELKRQRTILLFILVGLFLALVFAGFLYRSYRQKQKANIVITRQKTEVEEAYRIIEKQKRIVEEHNKDITDSINYAKRIQTALLASNTLLKKNLPEYFVLYKPKDIVSGDFYWATEATDDNGNKQFILCAGDCTGHGVPGAFMSLLNISKLNETINEKKIIRPDLILNNVRDEIIKALNPENATEVCNDGMDCILIAFEFNEQIKLYYAAANNSLYFIRNGVLTVGYADKIPVGKSSKDKDTFSLHTIELQKGDMVYALTDGYADQFGGEHGKKFKYRQLEELLLSCNEKPLATQKEILNKAIEHWKGDNEQIDDILIIGIRV
jgi:serine phosphatase RsbU (regulator of sigma subunit)